MASSEAVASALETIAAAFNRHPSWVAKCTYLWEREFASRTDGQLDRALRMWIRGQAKAPTMAELHQIMDGERRSGAPGQVNAEGCADCDGSGWRYAAWHRVEVVRGREQARVGSFALPCTCPRGAGMGQQTVPRMSATITAWQAHPGTTAIFVTDRYNLRLTYEERGLNARVKPG